MTISGALAASCAVATLLASAAAGQEAAAPAAQGEAVYQKWCAPCHYRLTSPAPLLERQKLTAAAVSSAVRNGVYVMPRFRKTEISDADLSALTAFVTRSAR